MGKKWPPAHELEGGFLHIRAKVYRGTIRTREDKRVVWTCNHNHYRPEYNARWSHDPRKVWETSGLNCGRAAYKQLLNGTMVKGDLGMVKDPHVSIDMRDDTRIAQVGEATYMGSVFLSANGNRLLRVASTEFDHVKLTLNLDLPPEKGMSPIPVFETQRYRELLTATWLLKGGVWGVVFQDPNVSMVVDQPMQRAIDELVGKKEKLAPEPGKSRIVLPEGSVPKGRRRASQKLEEPGSSEKLEPYPATDPETEPAKSTTPHIRVGRNEKGRRIFEVVGYRDDVVDQFVHRGPAVKRLEKLTRGRAS